MKGRPAYELARKKQPVELKSVDVELFEFKLNQIEGSIARFVIECSSGTYIRSLAHEMGQKLGCGAHLAEIERTAVGEFSLEQAVKLEELANRGFRRMRPYQCSARHLDQLRCNAQFLANRQQRTSQHHIHFGVAGNLLQVQ